MAIKTPNINLLKSFNFTKDFATKILRKTNTKVKQNKGRLVPSAFDVKIRLKDFSDRSEDLKIKSQKRKTHQERFIDIYT